MNVQHLEQELAKKTGIATINNLTASLDDLRLNVQHLEQELAKKNGYRSQSQKSSRAQR
ncbi:hypothetical protein BGP_6276 [Beggiatoa sp. PS]|nr:hypothetical protein BGP_6276 [Beggiatoa sp. PS]